MMKRWFALCITAAFAGCSLTDPTDPYEGYAFLVRGAKGNASAGLAGDRPAMPSGPLALDAAIAIALANNPEIAAVSSEVEAAAAQQDFAAGQLFPFAKASGSATSFQDPQRLGSPTSGTDPGLFSRNILGGEVSVSWPVFTGGRITGEIDAAGLLRRSAEYRLARAGEELAYAVTSVFIGILAQRRSVESLEFSMRAIDEHTRKIAELVQANKAARVDLLRAEVRLADLKQRTLRERNTLAVQIRMLSALLGLHPGSVPVEPAGDLSEPSGEAPQAEVLVGRALAGRPDCLAARAALEAKARAVDAARAGHWPTVSVFGALGGKWAADWSVRASGAGVFDDWGRVGLAVDIPIFEGGRIEARVRREKAEMAAARERLRKLEIQASLEVHTAILNLSSAIARIETASKAVEQAEESLRIEREKHELGKGAIIDVLDAQSALLDAQTAHFRSLADYNIALAQIKLATGTYVSEHSR